MARRALLSLHAAPVPSVDRLWTDVSSPGIGGSSSLRHSYYLPPPQGNSSLPFAPLVLLTNFPIHRSVPPSCQSDSPLRTHNSIWAGAHLKNILWEESSAKKYSGLESLTEITYGCKS